MGKTSVVHARIDPELKENVENILAQIGLTSSDAVSLLFKQIELNGGLPFELKIPRQKSHDEMYQAIMESLEEVRNGAKPIPIEEAFSRLEEKYVKR